MKILVFGGGDLAHAFARGRLRFGPEVQTLQILQRHEVDVTDYRAVAHAVNLSAPDFIVCTAGLSDLRIGVTLREVIETNLIGPMNVGTAAAAYKVPCLIVASTAGMSPGIHRWYGPAKAGVISFVRAMANRGEKIWAISPGRMDTKMREDDFPDEDRDTRLAPATVVSVMNDIVEGLYAPGANVVVRKVGLDRVDVYEDAAPVLPSLL